MQTFDLVVGNASPTEGAKVSWHGVVLGPAALSLVALVTWSYGWNIPSQVDPVWMATVVVLLTALGAFCTFVSHIIYVDFGRLEKYPSRIRL